MEEPVNWKLYLYFLAKIKLNSKMIFFKYIVLQVFGSISRWVNLLNKIGFVVVLFCRVTGGFILSCD